MHPRYRRLIIPGALVVLLVIVVVAAFTACGTPAKDFEAGECTNESVSGTVDEIDTVDCDEVHAAEAFARNQQIADSRLAATLSEPVKQRDNLRIA